MKAHHSIAVALFLIAPSLRAQQQTPSLDYHRATSEAPRRIVAMAMDSLGYAGNGAAPTKEFFVALTGGGEFGISPRDPMAGGLANITIIGGKHFANLSYSATFGGSITVGSKPWLVIMGDGSPPTVPTISEEIIEAEYGQRISTATAWSVGLSYVTRELNDRTTHVTSSDGDYWHYTSETHSFVALPVSISYLWRWNSWLGSLLKAQLHLSAKEITGNVSISVGFGAFPALSEEAATIR